MASQPKMRVPEATTVTAVFDPPVVRPGEVSFLRIVFNTLEESIEWPDKIVGPPQLEIRPGAHGQILHMSGTNMEPRTAFNYRVRASGLGSFTVPEFVVNVDGKPVTVPAARLEAVSAPPASVPPAPRLTLELPATNLYVGQPVTARIVAPAGLVQGLGLPQLGGQGILVDQASVRLRAEVLQRGGAAVPTFAYEATVTPVLTGKLTVFAQGFATGSRFISPVTISGPAQIPPSPPQYTLLESDPVELDVRPLPREGELPGFTGAIGTFTVGPPILTTNFLRVGDPVRLSVTLTNRSEGPLARLVAPPPPKVQDWQVFAMNDFAPAQPVASPQAVRLPGGSALAAQRVLPPPAGSLQGIVTFNYALLPLTAAAHATPPIPFSCFDPKTGTYVDLTIPSVPVTVKPGVLPGDFASLLQAGSVAGEPEKEPGLSGLAPSPGWTAASLVPPQLQTWFPLVQLAPAAAFFGLWSWDRRRRHLERHPDVVLRRRARRALRRQWRILRRAARAADAPRFAAAAVSAMRVACAPHYPAEPRALVGGDVLGVLPPMDRSGRAGEVVRRFFAVTDAARFATATPNAADLLPLQPELERILQQLEQRL